MSTLTKLLQRLWNPRPGKPINRPAFRPWCELLENRTLMSWSPIGPAPLNISQRDATGAYTEAVSGAIEAQAFGTDNDGNPVMFIGSPTGGLWRAPMDANFQNGNPRWVQFTDIVASSSVPAGAIPLDTRNNVGNAQTGLGAGTICVGSIAVDPSNKKHIYVGTGEPAYRDSLYGTGILESTNGGDTFRLLSAGPVIADDTNAIRADGLPAFYQRSIASIVINPSTPRVMYAIDSAVRSSKITPRQGCGVFKSTDAGATWTMVAGGVAADAAVAAMQPPTTKIGIDIRPTSLDYTTLQDGSFCLVAGV